MADERDDAGSAATTSSDPSLPEQPAPTVALPASDHAAATATRHDYQIGRRLFHLANGVAIASAYALLFSRSQVIHLFGIVACLVYIADRVRMHYPELLAEVPWVNQRFFRAEEQVREAAMTPYVIAILLTILTFPKAIALIAIYTLAIADPASALFGIRFGRHRIIGRKSVEGSLAFLVATAAVAAAVLDWGTVASLNQRLAASVLIAVVGALVELLPLRLDDNLTIPLGVAFGGWAACAIVGIEV